MQLRSRPHRRDVGTDTLTGREPAAGIEPPVRRVERANLAAIAAAAAGVQVGAAIVATRFVIEQTGPASLALLRYVIAICCLLPVALTAGAVRIRRQDLLPIALLGIGQFGLLIALLNLGLQEVSSARAALLFATFPVLTMLIAAALGHEQLTRQTTLGVLLTVAGVGFAVSDQGASGEWRDAGRGEIAVLGSALTGAVCSVLYRPYVRRNPILPVSVVAMLASIAVLALLAVREGFWTSLPPRFTVGGWLAVAFVGIGSGAGYVLWLWALGHTTATRVTVFLSLSPLTAIALGTLLLGESIAVWDVVAMGFTMLGLWLAHRPHPRHDPPR